MDWSASPNTSSDEDVHSLTTSTCAFEVFLAFVDKNVRPMPLEAIAEVGMVLQQIARQHDQIVKVQAISGQQGFPIQRIHLVQDFFGEGHKSRTTLIVNFGILERTAFAFIISPLVVTKASEDGATFEGRILKGDVRFVQALFKDVQLFALSIIVKSPLRYVEEELP